MSTVSERHSLVDALKQKAQEEKAAQQAGKGDKPDAQKPNVDMTSSGIVVGAEDGKSAHVVLKETGASHKFAIDSLTKKRPAPASEAATPAIATISVSVALVLQAYNHGIDADVFPHQLYCTFPEVLVALAATLRPAWLLFDGAAGADSKEPLLDFSPRSPLQDDEILAEPEEAPSRLLREEALERRPRRRIKGGLPPAAQLRMTRRARKIAASWAAILSTNGMGLVVDGRVMLVRLEGRQIHFDSEAFPLQEMALQLDGRALPG
ncbi:hypothetical protein AK812_SmicGene17627 [Symbiodinium microadriaticum]|uniref:Uncharacterized protein n=1 Tax=Symbiodinium microadriaticum TaxID=2951 RepID=A0A1Q9DX65_SYMMI|nr:hypothetical protein AK812_SmicGene17627 [Symbiodinium microadriaticum]